MAFGVFLDIDWDSLFQPYVGNVEMMWSVFKDKLLEGIHRYIPNTLPFSVWKKRKMEKTTYIQIRSVIKKVLYGNNILEVGILRF